MTDDNGLAGFRVGNVEDTIRYARSRGLCAAVSVYGHICTRFNDHDGQHNGVRVDSDEHVYHAWGCTCDRPCCC